MKYWKIMRSLKIYLAKKGSSFNSQPVTSLSNELEWRDDSSSSACEKYNPGRQNNPGTQKRHFAENTFKGKRDVEIAPWPQSEFDAANIKKESDPFRRRREDYFFVCARDGPDSRSFGRNLWSQVSPSLISRHRCRARWSSSLVISTAWCGLSDSLPWCLAVKVK